MDWRKRHASKVMSAEDAVADIQSGQWLAVGMFDGVPVGLCNALSARAADLEEVNVFHFVSAYPWFSFNEGKSFLPVAPLQGVEEDGLGMLRGLDHGIESPTLELVYSAKSDAKSPHRFRGIRRILAFAVARGGLFQLGVQPGPGVVAFGTPQPVLAVVDP